MYILKASVLIGLVVWKKYEGFFNEFFFQNTTRSILKNKVMKSLLLTVYYIYTTLTNKTYLVKKKKYFCTFSFLKFLKLEKNIFHNARCMYVVHAKCEIHILSYNIYVYWKVLTLAFPPFSLDFKKNLCKFIYNVIMFLKTTFQ